MLLTIPVSAADAGKLSKTAAIFKKFGPYAGFPCAIFARRDVENEARKFADEVRSLFSNLDIHILDFHAKNPTEAAAKHFRLVAEKVVASYPNEAWYFYELDNTPVKAGWLQALQREHHESGKPHMGAVVPTRGFTLQQDGSMKPSFGEPHMVGTGIYHGELGKRSPTIGQIDRVMPWAGPLEPFDIRMRFEIVPNAHNTRLIQHNWNTGKYRKEGGQIVCSDLSGDPNLDHSKPVDADAVVVHGCKDLTLADLVLADDVAVKAVAKEAPKVATQVEKQPEAPKEGDSKPPIQSFLTFKIIDAINKAAPKKLNAKIVGEQLGVSTAEVLAEIAKEGSGLKVAGVPKWVSLA